ncbi:serine integrase [Mycobacterium phage Skinny]|nr:serine integrase [Mycobacterium phage SirSheldon]UXE05308.1 serine integrase [Mycobacterium phage Skinny]WNN95690.1 serine integrase [Mycobacterium phage Glaske16]WNN96260.1 serine integrase [Mycobacterium phage Dulcita]WNO28204.1 serine integrase [Mycobacterium phage Diminimus]
MTATLETPPQVVAPPRLRAAVYLRMSTDKELGIDRQREDCVALCERLGWDPVLYVDNDRSAVKENVRREAYEQMCGDIRDGRIDAIITWRSDRLYRKMKSLLPLIDLIQGVNKNGKRIPIETCQTGLIDLTTDAGRMTAKILAAVAENEGEVRTARQMRAYEQIAESGRSLGAPAFGYTNDPKARVREIVPEEAAAIREGYDDVLAGCTLYSIAKKWNDRGLKTPRGNAFVATVVGRILRNPRYAGLYRFRGEIIGEGDWEPIVDVETWAMATAVLDGKNTGPKGPRVRTTLLSGIVRCGHCGNRMSASKNSNGEPIYKCKRYEVCNHGVTRVRKKVDKYVEARIVAKLEERKWVVGTKSDADQAKALHTEAETLRARKASFTDALVDGTLTPAQVKEASDKVDAKLEEIERQLARLTKSRVYDGLLGHDDLEAVWVGLPLDRKRAIIEQLCDKIVIRHVEITGRAAAKLPLGHNIDIYWHKPSDD